MNLDPALQLALRSRPSGRRVMVQKWRDLTFLHYSVDPQIIQEKLPKGLTVDTFDGKAWVALVPFWMTGIRFPFLPCVPGASTFPETNVRTYVHREGKDPGVWFFSLDAANALAVKWARTFFNLPYHRARMRVEETRYIAERCDGKARHDIDVEVGNVMPMPRPGSLEFFLIERYLLYAEKGGGLYAGLVSHAPYEIRRAKVRQCEESMLAANGLPSLPWEHVCYSSGVDVDVFGIKPV